MTVFANGLEISAKKQSCKVIAAFPDPCFTPPQTPATPPGVPVPYPVFGTDSDLTSGSGTVKVGGETVSQENASKYSKCSGDEAGAAPKKGVVTSKNTGAVYAQKWSMDVKADGKGVVRFGDLSTSNHACNPGQPAIPLAGQPGASGNATDADCLVESHDKIREECNKRRDPNDNAHESHHIMPDYVYRIGTRGSDVRLDPGTFPTEASGLAICLPRDQHRGAKSRVPESVHGNLDNKLKKLGQAINSPSSPANTATIKAIRKECIAALVKLVPKWISENCLKKAARAVVDQTQPFADRSGKTKNRPFGDKDKAAHNFLIG
jgi:hypothetical protein